MRIPAYMSPSSCKLFWTDRKKYYLRYLADNKEPRDPQNIHMAVGSAFDAFVKSQITADLGVEVQFDLATLFEAQVEPQHRQDCWGYGKTLLEAYKACGAYSIAVHDMGLAQLAPRFEFDINATILGVPVFGKPDAFYLNHDGTPTILDWKVNSWLGGNNMKKPWYVMDHQTGEHHPKVHISNRYNLPIVANKYMEDIDEDWAFQQFVYAIGLGSEIGDPFITSIDQVTGGPSFYTYRNYLSKPYQIQCAKDLKRAWEIINSGHIFDTMTREENDSLIEDLEGPFRDMF